jgi:hypothetical protein
LELREVPGRGSRCDNLGGRDGYTVVEWKFLIRTTVASVAEKHLGRLFFLLADLAILSKQLENVILMIEVTHIPMIIFDHRRRG